MTKPSSDSDVEGLRSLEWMLGPTQGSNDEDSAQPYGDVTALNTDRTILDAVGEPLLRDIVRDYLGLLETSSAVYEKNGDYAYGIFSSGWCRAMDAASFRACGTDDTGAALASGGWHCHESCWGHASGPSIESGAPIDVECAGGIRLYAVPIRAGDEIIGSINFGYGAPPRDRERLSALSGKYHLPIAELEENASSYRARPAFIIDLAKQRLQSSARLIGEIVRRRRLEEELRALNATLESRVEARTAELKATVQELEGFAYSVSHDLRAPLRAIDGFAKILASEHAAELSPRAAEHLAIVRESSQQMGRMIDDLLAFARLSRQPVRSELVRLDEMVPRLLRLLSAQEEPRALEIEIGELPPCHGDPLLFEIVWTNLLSNALKYTRRRARAQIEIGFAGGEYFVRDNGVGFDPRYADKLFGVFQRLHRAEDYEGVGLGLATAQRIAHRHGGRIRAEAIPEQGATFFLHLPTARPS